MNYDTPEMVFVMGLPAAGKTKFIADRLAETHSVIDLDQIRVGKTFNNAFAEFERQVYAAARSGAGKYVVEATANNPERVARHMDEAKANGFSVKLVYLPVPAETAVVRIAARGEHTEVLQTAVATQSPIADLAFSELSTHADEVEVVPAG